MKRKTVFLVFIVLAALSLSAVLALSSPGSQTDPLVPLSYINDNYIPGILAEAETRIKTSYNPIYNAALKEFEDGQDDWLIIGKNAALYTAVMKKLGAAATTKFTDVSLKKGDLITGQPGTGLMIRSGSAVVAGASGGVLINVTAGAERAPGSATAANVYYMAADTATGLRVTSDTAVIAVSGKYSLSPAYTVKYTKVAQSLNTLGLFRGTTTGFELDRAATRIEALVMLIRLLGEEDEALSHTGANPFTDVPSWAQKYAAYAYHMGYTKGTSATKFTPSTAATKEQYMTFLLRALSYSDSAGDFSWQDSPDYSVTAGILTAADRQTLQSSVFYRDQVVYTSYKALFATVKNSAQTLSEKLISAGVFTNGQFEAAKTSSGVE